NLPSLLSSEFTASSASSPSISPPRNILPLILSTPHSHFLVVASAAAATRFRCHLPLATKNWQQWPWCLH
ncbi:hypothetical protein SDJN02_03161, partial [Cucurbita argyrosperma subsp. argyrosperma]